MKFKYDIFLSYAHVDNAKGWVSRFQECLELALRQRGAKDITIWWDTDLHGNETFTPAIQSAIEESAVFVALTSPNYLQSSYCKQEVQWFCQKAEKEPCGLNIGAYRRLFNVLQYRIPHLQWMSEFAGTNAYDFFKPNRQNSLGRPLRPANFDNHMDRLADELLAMLGKLVDPLPLPLPSSRFIVYMAAVREPLKPRQAGIARLLDDLGIKVLEASPDPQTAENLISKAHVSVHLLDGTPDSVAEEQLEYGKRSQAQLIWLSKNFDLDKEPLSSYEQKLLSLKNRTDKSHPHEFIHSLDAKTDVVGSVKRLKERWAKSQAHSLFVNIHYNDMESVQEFIDYLDKYHIQMMMNDAKPQGPTKKEIEDKVIKSQAIVFVFGNVGRNWIEERVIEAFRVALEKELTIKFMGVYAAPPPENRNRKIELPLPINLVWMDNTNGFNPSTVEDLISIFVQ